MVLIAYDIKDEKRLKKVAKFLEEEGIRVQKSIFELEVSWKEGVRILQGIAKLINKEVDKCFLYEIKKREDLQKNSSFERIL